MPLSKNRLGRLLEGRRLPVAATVVVLGSVARILFVVHAQQPIDDWLIWSVIGYWALALYFLLGCLGLGVGIIQRCRLPALGEAEGLVLALPVGVFGFATGTFLVGLAGALGPSFCLFAPLVCAAACPLRQWRGMAARARAGLAWVAGQRTSATALGAIALAVLVLAAVYIPLLTVQNVQHDAYWYHLTIASQYASEGAVRPFAEGWILGAYPHLASLLYTWAMLLPVDIVHRVEVAAHMEWLIFLATIASVPLLIAQLSREAGRSMAWCTFFLFPGYLTYDSCLSLGADHIAALWATPLFVSLLRLWRAPHARHAALLGVFTAAAAATKYSAICLVAPAGIGALAVVIRTLASSAHGLVGRVRAAGAVSAAFAGSFILLWSPHWLKNLVWYGDPLYPLLRTWVHAVPWNATSEQLFVEFNRHEVVRGPQTLGGLLQALRYGLSYGMETRDYDFHGARPVFGFLFAAMLPVLPLLRVGRRTWALLGLSLVGIAAWYLTYSRDRYVQAMLPWLVAITAVGLHAAMHAHFRPLRWAVALLIGVQLVLGADVFFIRAHAIATAKHPLSRIMTRATEGTRGRMTRNGPGEPVRMQAWVRLGAMLPKDAKLLVHRRRLWLGLDRPVVGDDSAWQAGIDYDRIGSAHALWRRLRSLGVTHVLVGDYPLSRKLGPATVGGELVFWELLRHSRSVPWQGPWKLWALAQTPPPASPEPTVQWQTCKASPRADGVYALSSLGLSGTAPPSVPATRPTDETLAPAGGAPPLAVTQRGCPRLPRPYEEIAQRGALRLWWRPRAARPDDPPDS